MATKCLFWGTFSQQHSKSEFPFQASVCTRRDMKSRAIFGFSKGFKKLQNSSFPRTKSNRTGSPNLCNKTHGAPTVQTRKRRKRLYKRVMWLHDTKNQGSFLILLPGKNTDLKKEWKSTNSCGNTQNKKYIL